MHGVGLGREEGILHMNGFRVFLMGTEPEAGLWGLSVPLPEWGMGKGLIKKKSVCDPGDPCPKRVWGQGQG